MRPLFALVCLVATAASAQSVTLKYTFQDAQKYTFNASACNAKVQITWSSAVLLSTCSELKLWSTTGECGDNPATGDVRYDSIPEADLAFRKGNFEISLAELPGFKGSDAGTTCGTDLTEVAHRVCGSLTLDSATLGGACTVSQASSLALTYDTKPPVAPVVEKVTAQDSALKIEVSASAETAIVHVDIRAFGAADFSEKGRVTPASATSVTISNLTNGTTYDIRARSEDGAGNFSAGSELSSGTPRRTIGLFARYREAGGGERGGCAAAGGVPVLLAVGLWILRRKRG